MALLRELLPDAQEKVYPTGWKTIVYSFSGGMKDAMCAVNPQKKYVNLNFGRGVDLKDPKELLEGTGKSIRHVKIKARGCAVAGAREAHQRSFEAGTQQLTGSNGLFWGSRNIGLTPPL